MFSVIIIGGGAAGFFAALSAKNANPKAKVLLIERGGTLLSKVKISGGGRCNVTHACFEPSELVKNYPRGSRELLSAFSRFQPKDVLAWFELRGVKLKKEQDGRMFPITDSSSTIINALLKEAKLTGVEIRLRQKVKKIEKTGAIFHLIKEDGETLKAQAIILATGSSPSGHLLAASFGHTIVPPVPSLFTFNIADFTLKDLAGISVAAEVSLPGSSFRQSGPLLITHSGFSGPAILKLSAFAARFLAEKKYKTGLRIDWLPTISRNELNEKWELFRKDPAKKIGKDADLPLPKNLWKRFCHLSLIDPQKRFVEIKRQEISKLLERLKSDIYQIDGKTTHKEEFVTAGGILLKEINFKTMESRFVPGLYFVGEVLDIDGVTGGFNFQNAWTTGYLAGQDAVSKCF